MPLTREQMDRKMDEHFGYEARDDVNGVLSTLAPDALHDIVGWPPGPTNGREAARPFYERLFADLAEGKAQCQKRLYGENFLVDDSVWEGIAVGKPFGIEGKSRPVKFRLIHVFEFREDGLIQSENVWVDMAAIIRQLPND
jgi:hypothetical protein